MKQIPNYIVVLDFIHNRVVKIKLSDEEKQFASSCDDLEELVEALSEVYHFSTVNCRWMALDEYKEDSFGFDNNTEANLALSLVQTLSDKEVLDDVISSNDIESVRVCENCGKIMNEGWVYEGIENYCSDTCLKTSHPEIDIDLLKRQAIEDKSNSYWTTWEDAPSDK